MPLGGPDAELGEADFATITNVQGFSKVTLATLKLATAIDASFQAEAIIESANAKGKIIERREIGRRNAGGG